MAAKKKVFWLGELVGKRRVGRIKVDGKHVRIGESFAADGLDKDRLSTLRKAGCIGDANFLVAEPVGDDNTMLQRRIKELEGEVERLTVEAKEAANLKAAHVQKHIDNPVAYDAELSKELETVKSDNEEKAALIKDQKEEVARLTSELDEATKPKDDKK